MTWEEVCSDKALRNLPYKIELNKYGNIIMSPASNFHGYLQSEIQAILRELVSEGKVFPECSVETDDGVKVPDVVWINKAFYEQFQFTTPYPIAPTLCVEVVSPSNSDEEMDEKRALYFKQGAREVWLCGIDGEMTFYTSTGKVSQSVLLPLFPERVG